MNPFFDINDTRKTDNIYQLYNLGSQVIYMTLGQSGRTDFGTSQWQSSNYYRATTKADYDKQFVNKIKKWDPIYNISLLIEHHYRQYLTNNPDSGREFIKHMRYVILPMLRDQKNSEVRVELFEQWLNDKEPKSKAQLNSPNTVNNNTINVGNIHAPTQFQQNSNHSTQSQHNRYQKEDIKEVFELLQKDIQHVNEQIRTDFATEMDYAMMQLDRERDIRPQLLNIGSLIKDVGMGTFTNLLAAPIFEIIKPCLGLT